MTPKPSAFQEEQMKLLMTSRNNTAKIKQVDVKGYKDSNEDIVHFTIANPNTGAHVVLSTAIKRKETEMPCWAGRKAAETIVGAKPTLLISTKADKLVHYQMKFA